MYFQSTFRQVVYVNNVAIGGEVDVKWSYTWSNFAKKPIICDGKLEFSFKVKLKCSYKTKLVKSMLYTLRDLNLMSYGK